MYKYIYIYIYIYLEIIYKQPSKFSAKSRVVSVATLFAAKINCNTTRQLKGGRALGVLSMQIQPSTA